VFVLGPYTTIESPQLLESSGEMDRYLLGVNRIHRDVRIGSVRRKSAPIKVATAIEIVVISMSLALGQDRVRTVAARKVRPKIETRRSLEKKKARNIPMKPDKAAAARLIQRSDPTT
jgi:hypothetical protein